MGNPYRILNWLGAIAFALAFVDSQNWFAIPVIRPYDIYIMAGASVISFLSGNALRWLGIAIVAFGMALVYNLVNLNLGNVNFNPVTIILSGYLLLFFNSR